MAESIAKSTRRVPPFALNPSLLCRFMLDTDCVRQALLHGSASQISQARRAAKKSRARLLANARKSVYDRPQAYRQDALYLAVEGKPVISVRRYCDSIAEPEASSRDCNCHTVCSRPPLFGASEMNRPRWKKCCWRTAGTKAGNVIKRL
jgi:hypothetical protein